MKWYIAARLSERDAVRQTLDILRKRGEEVAYDWTNISGVKPYSENITKCERISGDILKALEETEIFILLSDESGTDMFIELGIALERKRRGERIRIYTVGDYNTSSLMLLNESIKRVNSLEEILREELG